MILTKMPLLKSTNDDETLMFTIHMLEVLLTTVPEIYCVRSAKQGSFVDNIKLICCYTFVFLSNNSVTDQLILLKSLDHTEIKNDKYMRDITEYICIDL